MSLVSGFARSQDALVEAERQKALVLAYVDFVKARHEEVISAIVENQEEER